MEQSIVKRTARGVVLAADPCPSGWRNALIGINLWTTATIAPLDWELRHRAAYREDSSARGRSVCKLPQRGGRQARRPEAARKAREACVMFVLELEKALFQDGRRAQAMSRAKLAAGRHDVHQVSCTTSPLQNES